MKVVNIGNIADAFRFDDLPATGIVIEATPDELERLPNLTYKEVTISETLGRERGDAAKLREALLECAQYIACVGGVGVGEVTINDSVRLMPEELAQKAIAALAAQPRNCDRFASAKEAIEYHKRTNCAERRYCAYHDGCPTDGSCVVNWLYAEAKEGGAK